MSIDERLRAGLAAQAHGVKPDVDSLLTSTLERSRRRHVLRWAAAGLALAAAACLAILLAVSVGELRTAPPGPAERTTTTSGFPGAYAGDVAALSTVPSVRGRWVLDFGEAGQVGVVAPSTHQGVVSGVQYAVANGRLRIDLFSQDLCSGLPLGTYRVSLERGVLTLTPIQDPCTARSTFLSRTEWTAAPAATGGGSP